MEVNDMKHKVEDHVDAASPSPMTCSRSIGRARILKVCIKEVTTDMPVLTQFK